MATEILAPNGHQDRQGWSQGYRCFLLNVKFSINDFESVSADKQALLKMTDGIDGLVQERRNSSVLAMKLCLSCTNPLISKDMIVLWEITLLMLRLEYSGNFINTTAVDAMAPCVTRTSYLIE